MGHVNELGAHGVPPSLRRALTITMAVLAALAVVQPLAPVAAHALDSSVANVSGIIYKDKNGNSLQDSGEPGVAGVSVSDGAKTVTTDDSGRYTLDIDLDRRLTDMVFITQPAGYAVPVDEYKTPQFYRSFGELADGAQVEADFGLLPDPKSNGSNFTFANLADVHINTNLADQLREINATAQDLAFVQVSGDLTNNASAAEFDKYRNATAASELPVWPAVGNHEYRPGTTYAAQIDNYRRHVGPEWYSFDYGDRHFIVLENNGAAPFEEQRAWAEQDLATHAQGKRVVVLMHQPMNVPFGASATYDTYADLLEQYDTELVLVGHEHSNDIDKEWVKGARHVQTNSSESTIDDSPRGFRYVHMNGDGSTNPFRMYGVEQSLAITSPAPDSKVSADGLTEIQVNAYQTADEVREVRYRLDGDKKWYTMESSGDFTWFASYPEHASRSLGEHSIEVEVEADGGATWSKSATFTLTSEAPAVVQAGTDWPQLHGDAAHSGVSQDILVPDLGLAWTYRTPGTILTGSPAIVGGIAYVGTRDENDIEHNAVHAVDLATGERLWQARTESLVHGSVAVADGLVFVPTIHGTLHAFDAATGVERWQRTPEPSGNQNNQRSVSYYSPAVAEGKVYWPYQTRYGKASQGLLTALDTKTGATIWESPMTGGRMSDGTPAIADGRVYVGNQEGDRVLAYDANTGQRLWTSSNVLGRYFQDGAPTAAGGKVFIGSGGGVVARDAATGATLWTYRSPDTSYIPGNATPSPPAIVGNTLYMGFPDGRVTALDVETGAVMWSVRLPGKPYLGGVISAPAVSGDTVYVGNNDGHLYALNRTNGEQVWSYEIGTWVASSPAISGNSLLVGAWDGNLYAFTAKK